jgi:hypothetical protein
MSVETKVTEAAPKRGRISQNEIDFIQKSSSEGKLTIREIATSLGRSVGAVIKHLPDEVVAQLLNGEAPKVVEATEAKDVIPTTVGPVNPYPISKNQIGESGIGRRDSLPDNGNIAVMHKGASDRGDISRELYESTKAARMKLMQAYTRPIKGVSKEQVVSHELDLKTCTTEAKADG